MTHYTRKAHFAGPLALTARYALAIPLPPDNALDRPSPTTDTFERSTADLLPLAPGVVTTLRGAPVSVDPRQVAQVLAVVVTASLLVAVVSLVVAGLDRNAAISGLHAHGVATTARVTRCQGLLGGSGSNPAGYACSASFELAGKRYVEGVPGDVLLGPGTEVSVVVDREDPGIIDLPGDLRNEHASWHVFVVPAALLVVMLALAGAVAARRRSAPGVRRPLRAPGGGGERGLVAPCRSGAGPVR